MAEGYTDGVPATYSERMLDMTNIFWIVAFSVTLLIVWLAARKRS